MKKDIAVATAVGFFIGVVAAIFILQLPKIVTTGKISPTAVPSPSAAVETSSKSRDINLIIQKPENESFHEKKSIEIQGTTLPYALLIAKTENEIYLKEASQDGTFSFAIDLSEGINEVFLTSANENGDSQTSILNLFYTPEEL